MRYLSSHSRLPRILGGGRVREQPSAPLPSGHRITVSGVQAVRAPWSSASFLTYLGGITILAAVGSLLQAQAGDHGAAGVTGWALLVFLAVTVFALLAHARGHRVTGGLLALSSVAASVVFLGALLAWFGWLAPVTDSPFRGFRVSLLFLELALVVAAALALALFRFPLLVLVLAAGSWFFVTDLLSGGGDWSAAVAILIGLTFLGIAVWLDTIGERTYAFWVHVAAGLALGGGFLWFFHHGDWDWILVGIAGLLYVALGERLRRSSWVVLGAWGVLQTAAHFAVKWSEAGVYVLSAFYLFPFVFADVFDESGQRSGHAWAGPLVFAATGALFVGLGLLIARRRRAAEPL